MIKICDDYLTDFINWLNVKYPCKTDVTVNEVFSLASYDVDESGNVRNSCIFSQCIACYIDGVCEIYIPNEDIAKFLLNIDINDEYMTGYENFTGYTIKDYLLESFAHEYYHHIQYETRSDMSPDKAELFAKRVFKEYKNSINNN